MDISIIIVNYNGLHFLKNCLDSCQKINYPDFNIIIVDNGSTDGTRKYMYEYICKHKNTIFFDYYYNVGLAKAQNKGASFSTADYLFFLNNDTLVEPDILTNLINFYPNFQGVLGCRMGDYDGTRELDSFISVDRFCYPTGTTNQMFYPDGAIFINKKTFDEIGGFDEKLFLYGEDRDLCWRVWLSGNPCLPCPTAVFYHASSCVSDTNYFRRRIAERNLIRSMLKNYSRSTLISILAQYAILSSLELMFLVLTGRGASLFKSYFPAYWWNIKNIKDTLEERKKVQKMRKVDDKYILKIMSKQIGKIFVLRKFGIPKFVERKSK